MLAEDDALALPILSHPAWLGTFAISPEQGVAHHVIFGQLPRLAGADATIFVNHGGRFAFSRDDCRGIVEATEQPMGHLKPIFPIPAGGMTLDRLPEMAEFYGREAIFLIAGGLYSHGPDLVESSREFRRLVEQIRRSDVKQDKYSVIISNFGNRADRFLSGYGEDRTFAQLCDSATRVPDLSGVEIVGTWHITPRNVAEVKDQLESHNLKLVSIIPDHFASQIYGRGAFTSKDAAVRARAIADTKEMMDIAAELGCDLINVWNGQDGYDYPFQADYIQERDWLVDGLRQCAQHRGDVRLSLEYKPKEPRNRSYLGNVAGTLSIAQEIGLPNVGVTIDVGHALAAYEDVGESIAILGRAGNKLFHMHFNDNYRLWDDDMIVGSVHTIEYLELLYWLDRTGYEGYLSMDQYPYREDTERAISESIQWLKSVPNHHQSGRDGHDHRCDPPRGCDRGVSDAARGDVWWVSGEAISDN